MKQYTSALTRFFLIVVTIAAAALLSACGPSNNVRLLPPPPLEAGMLPAPTAPRITVVTFADKREDSSHLGLRRDGSSFVAAEDVAQWVSKALADELSRSGMQVSYALTLNQARSGNPDYLVTGALDEARLRENSATELSTTLRANYVLASRDKRLMSESLNAGQTRSGLPSSGAAENLLLDTLKDLVKPMAHKIVQTIEARK